MSYAGSSSKKLLSAPEMDNSGKTAFPVLDEEMSDVDCRNT
jgi:hypothetical protein